MIIFLLLPKSPNVVDQRTMAFCVQLWLYVATIAVSQLRNWLRWSTYSKADLVFAHELIKSGLLKVASPVLHRTSKALQLAGYIYL